SALTGGGTLNLTVDYVRGALSGNWAAFTGFINVTGRIAASEFRIANATICSNASVFLTDNVVMDRNGGSATIEVGALSGTTGAVVGPGNSSSSGTTYRVGWNNRDAVWNGTLKNDGTTTVVKVGTGKWTFTSANTWSGGFTISGGTVLANNTTGSGIGSGAIVVNS